MWSSSAHSFPSVAFCSCCSLITRQEKWGGRSDYSSLGTLKTEWTRKKAYPNVLQRGRGVFGGLHPIGWTEGNCGTSCVFLIPQVIIERGERISTPPLAPAVSGCRQGRCQGQQWAVLAVDESLTLVQRSRGIWGRSSETPGLGTHLWVYPVPPLQWEC